MASETKKRDRVSDTIISHLCIHSGGQPMTEKQATHTEGPWDVVEGQGRDGSWEASVYQGDIGTICRLDDEMIGHKANARLIAAVPGMVKTLERVKLALCDYYKGDTTWDEGLERDIDTILAKAQEDSQ